MSGFVNTLRQGSAAWAAVEAVKENGPLAPDALALLIERPVAQFDMLLGFAIRQGFLQVDAAGQYVLGDGVQAEADRAEAGSAAAPPAAAASTKPELTKQVLRDLAPEVVAEYPAQLRESIESVTKVDEPQLAAPLAAEESLPAEPQRSPAPRTVEEMARRAVVRIERSPKPERRPVPPPAASKRMVASWRSDGVYVIEKGGARIELDAGEAQELFAHMAKVARAA